MSTVAVIGMGTMGKAIFARLSGTYKVVGIDKLAELSQTARADFVIIAVKPQSFADLSRDLKKYIGSQCIISIMAGITTGSIAQNLATKNVVRTMPTLALTSGKSLTAAFGTTADDAEALLRLWGDVMWLEGEDKFDSFTALAGSGPAYFLELVAQLQAQAIRLGFNKKQSQLIANKTLVAATAILGEESASSRIKAKSTGQGVTEAALAVLAHHHFDTLISEVVNAAKIRSEELSK